MKNKKKISGKELTWYIIAGVIALGGLGLIITGLIGDNLNVTPTNNPIRQAEGSLGVFTFRTFGLMFFAIGATLGIITLLFNSKKSDREADKALRRSTRAQSSLIVEGEVEESAPEVIEEVKAEEPLVEPTPSEE